jgi:hypothetical protein
MSKVMQHALPSRSPRALGFTGIVLACSLGMLVSLGMGCTRAKLGPEGRVSQDQAESYLHAAIRQSSEGIVLDPQREGLDQIERVRLGEIAQQLRGPAAVCFLERAIETMEAGTIDGEPGWVDVPEGQIKLRARIAIDGTVMTTDVLESGFTDEHMETCVSDAIRKQRFVESRDSFAYYIDVYYWVSLGFFAEAQSDDFAVLMRRQQAQAGLRATGCLRGRVPPGTYAVSGLNLFDREGRSVVNRIERGSLPSEVSACLAGVFKAIRIHAEPDSFVRPAAPKVEFTVADDGTVSFADQRWLELVELEERAIRDQRKADLLDQSLGVDEPVPDGWIDRGEPDEPDEPDDSKDAGESTKDPGESSIPQPSLHPKPQPTGDPSKPGTKIDLSPGRGR